MSTFEKLVLDGSTNGRAIQVASTATPGNMIHTGPTTTTTIDEVWLYASNTSTTDVKLTVEWGNTGTSDQIEITVPGESGLVPIVPGLIIKGATSALVVRAFTSSSNVINIFGFVNRIIQ
jgi:hypothetical protein